MRMTTCFQQGTEECGNHLAKNSTACENTSPLHFLKPLGRIIFIFTILKEESILERK